MPTDLIPEIPVPPDATEMFDWVQRGPGLARRAFAGTIHETAGFTVRIEGIQRENRTCRRWVTVERGSTRPWSGQELLEPKAVRQLASALIAAADEIEARR